MPPQEDKTMNESVNEGVTANEDRNKDASSSTCSKEDENESMERKMEDQRVCFYLPILVTLDMFAVSLVVPLLNSYYVNAGVTSARQREFLSSAYTSAQILGGIMIGAAGDAGVLSRKNILLLSFVGSAISYGVIGFAGHSLYAVVLSRILVGLVKQTMTVGTALLAQHTSKEERTAQMGRLNSSFTIAWMIGPSAGAILYKQIGPYSPAYLACGLFGFITLLGFFLLPDTQVYDDVSSKETPETSTDCKNRSDLSNFENFRCNLRSCFSSKALASTIISLLLYGWMSRATSYQSLGDFYEEMYGIETHQRGYISSYKSVLSFVIQSFLIRPLLNLSGDERRAATLAGLGLALATVFEAGANLNVYLLLVCPIVSITVSILSLTLKSLLTQVAPKGTISSALAALDILQNIVAVSVPFYRTALFSLIEYLTKCAKGDVDQCMMTGDPEPRAWLLSSAIHWFLFTISVHWLLSRGFAKDNKEKTD